MFNIKVESVSSLCVCHCYLTRCMCLAFQDLRSIVQQCLQNALQLNAKSIAFPVIGAGGLGFPPDTACRIMISEVVNVVSGLGNSALNDISFVVFSHAQLVTAFQQEFAAISGQTTTQAQTSNAISVTEITTTVRSIEFRIFGKSKDSVDRAQAVLTKGLSEACSTQKVENEAVSKLSDRQCKLLTKKARELDVTIKFDTRMQRVVVRGDPIDVTTIINDIWEEVQKRIKKDKDNEQANVLYKTVRWKYELHGTTRCFSKLSNALIENAHANNKSRATVELEGDKFVIILASYTGTGTTSGQIISVSRTTVGSSWKRPR